MDGYHSTGRRVYVIAKTSLCLHNFPIYSSRGSLETNLEKFLWFILTRCHYIILLSLMSLYFCSEQVPNNNRITKKN